MSPGFMGERRDCVTLRLFAAPFHQLQCLRIRLMDKAVPNLAVCRVKAVKRIWCIDRNNFRIILIAELKLVFERAGCAKPEKMSLLYWRISMRIHGIKQPGTQVN